MQSTDLRFGTLKPRRHPGLWILTMVLLVTSSVHASDWSQWRGPNRHGRSTETGLLNEWPEGGPRLIWTVEDIGQGYSTVSIKDGLIYITGIVGEELVVTAFDLDGNVKWRTPHGPGWSRQRSRPGSRATPTVDGDRLYLISGHGKLASFHRTTGKKLWTVDLMSTFDGKVPGWGGAESVLIDGDRLICTPGGQRVGVVALDKITGKTIWEGDPLETPAPYASPILVEFGGVRQFVSLVQSGLVGVDANDGRFLWRYRRAAPPNRPACSDPLYFDGYVFGASGYNNGGGLVKLAVEGTGVTAAEVWETNEMVNQHGGMVIVDGHIYGNHHNGWSCLSWETGEPKWHDKGVGKGSLTYADGMLYCVSEQSGTVGLVRATPTAFEMTGTFKMPSGGEGPYWAHPVVCGGRLYLRHADALHAYDIQTPQ